MLFYFVCFIYDKNISFPIPNVNSDMACCFQPMTCFTFHVLYIAFTYGFKTNALCNESEVVYAKIVQHKIKIFR